MLTLNLFEYMYIILPYIYILRAGMLCTCTHVHVFYYMYSGKLSYYLTLTWFIACFSKPLGTLRFRCQNLF
jgi:hypothetical protein